jgi:hypothetical protein
MNSEWFGPIYGRRVFHPFPGFLANAIAVCHPITQVNINHVGCIVIDNQRLHSFPAFPEVTFCRSNVHIRKGINFLFVPPTQPLHFPVLWCLLFSVIDV